MRGARIASDFAASSLAAVSAVAAAAPTVGRFDAQLCVTLSADAPSCGAAEVEWQPNGHARVRVSDISYHLLMRGSQVEVVLTHGAMQIDEFIAPFEWVGRSLRFVDANRSARYEVRLGERKAARP